MTLPKITACMLAAALAGSSVAAEFYVSPDGDDRNDGSAAKPVKTLQRALDLTRKVEREEDKDIAVAPVEGRDAPLGVLDVDADVAARPEDVHW